MIAILETKCESPRTGVFARAVIDSILGDLGDEDRGLPAQHAVGANWHWTVTGNVPAMLALRRAMTGDWSIRSGRCESSDGVGHFYPRPMD